MSTISTRISEELEKELNEFMEEEKLEKSVALRKLISEGLEEWRKSKAVELLKNGDISFIRAAEMSGMDVWKFAIFIKEKKANWVKDERIKEDIGAV